MAPNIYRDEGETICHSSGESRIVLKYRDFGSRYCREYWETGSETRRVKLGHVNEKNSVADYRCCVLNLC